MQSAQNSLGIDVENQRLLVADRGRSAARIPDTPERRRLERQRSIRQIVFGAQDGVLTALGVATGVGSATNDRATVLLTASVSLVVGALSMGVGEYLGGKAEREVVESAIAFEELEMLEKPEEEFEEQLAYYKLKGFTDDEALMIVRRLQKNPEIWLHEMVRDEFGIDVRERDPGGLGAPAGMAGSFALGALVPIVPYLFPVTQGAAMTGGLVLAALGLFGIGAFAGRIGGRSPLRKGLEIAGFGTGVFVLSMLAGRLIPHLFGHGAIAAGG